MIGMLRNEAGRLSIARVATVVAFALWIFTWLYTLLLDKNYAHMEIVTIASLILFFVVLLNKTISSRFVSVGENEVRPNGKIL